MPKVKSIPADLTDEEEARVQAGIAADPDNPEWTNEDFARARPASDVLPTSLYAALTRPRGRPKAETTKEPVKLRLDPEVVAYFREGGPGWQTRMNRFLGLNKAVLRLIDEEHDLIEALEMMLSYLRSGELRVVTEPAEKTLARVEKNARHVKDTLRVLREQLLMP